MAFFYLKREDTGATLELDTNIISLDISGAGRSYEIVNLFTDGGNIRGFGYLGARELRIYKRHRIAPGVSSGTAWNTTRDAINAWALLPESVELNLYVKNTDESKTYKTRIYGVSSGDETWDNLKITNQIQFTFSMVNGIFENITATTESDTITGTALHTMTFTVTGNRQTPPLITFTPSTDFSIFQVQRNDDYGVRLESTFNSGEEIIYNCSTGTVTIEGVEVPGIQTAGSPFYLLPGSNTISIYATAGDIDISYNERVL